MRDLLASGDTLSIMLEWSAVFDLILLTDRIALAGKLFRWQMSVVNSEESESEVRSSLGTEKTMTSGAGPIGEVQTKSLLFESANFKTSLSVFPARLTRIPEDEDVMDLMRRFGFFFEREIIFSLVPVTLEGSEEFETVREHEGLKLEKQGTGNPSADSFFTAEA